MSDWDIMLIGFGYFPGCSRPGLFVAKDADVKSICIKGTYARITYVNAIDAIKHLGINLESS